MFDKILMISIDAGKGETKYAFQKDEKLIKDSFFTRGRKLRANEDAETSAKNYELEIDGQRWGLGDSYGENDLDNSNSKNTILHRMATFITITIVMDALEISSCSNVILTVTAPTSSAKNKEFKLDLVDNLKGERKICVNGKYYMFNINKVAVRPESTGILYRNPELFKDKNVLSVDLGFLNMNVSRINKMKVMQNESLVDFQGMQALYGILNSYLGCYNQDAPLKKQELNDALDNGYYKRGGVIIKESYDKIKQAKQEFFNDFTNTIQTKHFYDNYDLVVFSGATSKVLKDVIEENIPNNSLIVEDPQFANVEGNYYWMKTKLE